MFNERRSPQSPRSRWTTLTTLFLIMSMMMTLFAACSLQPGQSSTPVKVTKPTVMPEKIDPHKNPITTATVTAVGDVMMHSTQLPGYYDATSKTYNFDGYFTYVKELLTKSNWAMANLETTLSYNRGTYTGYPLFHSPSEIAGTLKRSGFTVVTTANNHSLDKGGSKVISTLDALDEFGLEHTGTARSQEEQARKLIVEQNGIKMGILAYANDTNGMPIPSDMPYAINLINEQQIIADIKAIKQAGADFVTVALHYGVEYQLEPNDFQKNLSRSLIAAGADFIAGSHPHVVQPYEYVNVRQSDGSTRQGVIIYSMGNFISNMYIKNAKFGLMMKLTLEKNSTSKTTRITAVEPILTWVHKYKTGGKTRYNVLPVADLLNNKIEPVVPLSTSELNEIKTYNASLTKVVNSMKDTPFTTDAK